jgi:hypothetical protein
MGKNQHSNASEKYVFVEEVRGMNRVKKQFNFSFLTHTQTFIVSEILSR